MHRHRLDSMLLWLCCRVATVVLIRLLEWDLPYAMSEALKIGQKLIISHVSEVVMVECKLNDLEENLAMNHAYTTMNILCLRLL